jgi:diacylglycerol kinase family enzyme
VIVVFVNPRSRGSRKDPGLVARMEAVLGDQGRVIASRTFEELDGAASALAATPPRVIAVHGGDGTLHVTLTALIRAFGDRPLPPVAILGGGTMNVVTSSLGIRDRPIDYLTRLVASVAAGKSLTTIDRRCLRVGERFGFVFGNGIMANFLAEYYEGNSYGPLRALLLMARLLMSALVRGSLMRRVFRRFRGRVVVDDKVLEFPDLVAVGAGFVREVGLGFKLFDRADDDPDRFAVLAIHSGALALFPDLWSIRAGRGIARRRAFSEVATRVEITGEDAEMVYTIDGDIYRAPGPLPIGAGPRIAIVDPRRI